MEAGQCTDVWQLCQKGSLISYPLATSGLIFIGCEECDILLQCPGVENRHAVISYDILKQEFWIKDLNSVTGTYINGVRIPEQSYFKLSHEDSIRFGYGPIFLLRKSSEGEPDLSLPEDDPTYLADSLEDVRDSDPSVSSTGQPDHSSASSMTSSASPLIENSTSSVALNIVLKSPSKSAKSSNSIGSNHVASNSSEILHRPSVMDDVNRLELMNTSKGSSRNSQTSSPPLASAPMAFTIPFESDSSSSSKTFTRRKPPTRLKESYTSNTNRTKATLAPSTLKLETLNGEPTEPNESVRETASFLIERMLGDSSGKAISPPSSPTSRPWDMTKAGLTWVRPKKSSTTSSPHSSSTNNSPLASPDKKPSDLEQRGETDDNDDTKSETGTYTVDTDQADPQVTEARNKIEEVFGLQKFPQSPPRSVKLPDNHPGQLPSSLILKPNTFLNKGVGNIPVAEVKVYSTNFIRPVSSKLEDCIPKLMISSQKSDLVNSNMGHKHSSSVSSLKDLEPPKPPARPLRASLGRSGTVTKFDPSALMSQSALALSSVETAPHSGQVLRQQSVNAGHRDAWSDENSPPQSRAMSSSFHAGGNRSNSLGGDKDSYGGFWRRKSWNLSCSDLEGDQNKSETGSVVSDVSTSTEPSSHSSCGGRLNRITQDGGPQMRLNRAFALRRARLGFESDDAIPNSVGPHITSGGLTAAKSKECLHLPQRGSSASASKSSLGNLGVSNLSRQDGGRFSLRLPRSSTARMGRTSNIGQHNSSPSASLGNSSAGTTQRQASGWVMPSQRGIVFPNRRDPQPQSSKPVGIPTPTDSSVLLKSKREVSALDGLVITAVHQLSNKLRNASCNILEKERLRFPERSECRLMIDEMLPSANEKKLKSTSSSFNGNSDGSLTRDLSTILKNLKKVEQTLEVLASIGDHSRLTSNTVEGKREQTNQRQTEKDISSKQKDPRSFFIVDV